MTRSFLWQDGSNELSHAQIRTPAAKTDRAKRLLLYRALFDTAKSQLFLKFVAQREDTYIVYDWTNLMVIT